MSLMMSPSSKRRFFCFFHLLPNNNNNALHHHLLSLSLFLLSSPSLTSRKHGVPHGRVSSLLSASAPTRRDTRHQVVFSADYYDNDHNSRLSSHHPMPTVEKVTPPRREQRR